jgi:YD repeat-containing protein
VVSPELAQTNNTYDEAGRLARATGPARTIERYGQAPQTGVRPVVTYGYNAFGDQTVVEDPAGRQTIASLDERGFPETVTLPSYTVPGGTPVTRTITAEHDDAGRVTAQTDPLGRTTALTYNTLGLPVAQTDPAAGNDAAGVWRYVYDDAGRQLEQRDPTGAVARQRWDDLGRVTGVEEVVRQPALGSYVTGNTVGDAGQTLRSHTAEGVVSTASYDLAGRLTSRADADGNATLYGYDGLSRLVSVTVPDGRRVEQHHDLLGNTTGHLFYSAADALLGQTAYTYDKEGRLLTEASPRGVAGGYATGYQYDAAGQLTQRTTPVASGQSILETWGYDALGEATRYTDGRNNTTSQNYNALGLPEDAIEPAAGPHTTEAQRRWRSVYDANGNVTSQQSPGGVTVTSTYDELGRLASQAGSGAQASTTTRSFDYDSAGNLLSAALTGGGTQSFTYDDRGLMLSASGVSGSSSFVYDGDGQMTQQTDSSGTTQWSYDDRGLPESMTSSLAGSATYAIDESGRPETVDYGSGTTRTYTYDAWGQVDTDVLKTLASAIIDCVDYIRDVLKETRIKVDAGYDLGDIELLPSYQPLPPLPPYLLPQFDFGPLVCQALGLLSIGPCSGGGGGGGDPHHRDEGGPAKPKNKCNPTCTVLTNPNIVPESEDTDSVTNINDTGCASGNRDGPCGAGIDVPTITIPTKPPPTTVPRVPEINIEQAEEEPGPAQIPEDTLERPKMRVGDDECGFATGKGDVGWGELADIIWDADPVFGCSGPPGSSGSPSQTDADRLRDAVRTRYVEIRDPSSPNYQPKKARGPVLTGAMYRPTGEIYFGLNTGVPDPIDPDLERRIAEMGPGAPFKGEPGSHSEINAINQGILAHPGATVDDFLIYSVRLRGSEKGQRIPRCPNCEKITDGAEELR